MLRKSQRHAIALGSVALIAAFSVAHTGQAPVEIDHPGVARIVSSVDLPDTRAVSRLPEGIRSYGKGAVRFDLSTLGVIASGGSKADGSGPGVDAITKISGASMAGSVSAFTVSPDGQTAVYIADQETAGRFELYSVPVDGSASPTKISAGLSFGAGDEGVSAFQISADSAKVVFTADPNLGGGSDDIFSVPIDGSASPVQLSPGAAAPVPAFGVGPDSSTVGFFGTDTVFGAGTTELYSATIGVASSGTQISDVGDSNTAGAVAFADFSPDSAWLVYAADAIADDVFQWFSVPSGATGPGSDVRISNALTSVELMAVSPDSSRVAYTSDDGVAGVMGIWTKPIGGGTKIRLAPGFPSGAAGASFLAISPDSGRVGYLADQNTAGVIEVYSALITVADSGTRLNTAMTGAQSADTLNISPDSATVLYEADQDAAGTYELYAAPIDASAGPSTLHGMTPPDNAGFFAGLGTPIVGVRAVYPVIGNSIDLFSVPCDGSASFVQINDAVASGDKLISAYIPTSGTRLMAYGVGPDQGTVTDEINAAPVRGDLPPEQLNVTAGVNELGVLGYEITSDEIYAVYLQDQDTDGKPELYSVELDSDADSVVNGLDNCPYAANGSQDPVVFGQTVLAASKTRFTWDDPTELRFVRGPLSGVGVYATDDSGTLSDAASFADGGTPAANSGWYYLFAPDCSGRSYQTELGAQPDRDLAVFP
jgi:Tol biopolymer transport system component